MTEGPLAIGANIIQECILRTWTIVLILLVNWCKVFELGFFTQLFLIYLVLFSSQYPYADKCYIKSYEFGQKLDAFND